MGTYWITKESEERMYRNYIFVPMEDMVRKSSQKGQEVAFLTNGDLADIFILRICILGTLLNSRFADFQISGLPNGGKVGFSVARLDRKLGEIPGTRPSL